MLYLRKHLPLNHPKHDDKYTDWQRANLPEQPAKPGTYHAIPAYISRDIGKLLQGQPPIRTAGTPALFRRRLDGRRNPARQYRRRTPHDTRRQRAVRARVTRPLIASYTSIHRITGFDFLPAAGHFFARNMGLDAVSPGRQPGFFLCSGKFAAFGHE